jgi:hypothetical protein
MKLVCKNKHNQPLGNAQQLTVVASQESLTVPFRLRMLATELLIAFDLDLLTRWRLLYLFPLAGRSHAMQIPPFLLFSKLHPAVLIRRQLTAALSWPLAHDS